jgi:hypothetical protein
MDMSKFVIADLSVFELELPECGEIAGGARLDLSRFFDRIPFLRGSTSTPPDPRATSTYSVDGTSGGNATYQGEEGQVSVSQEVEYS